MTDATIPMSLRIRNVLANWGTYVFATALAFFLSPYVVQHLGDAGYGVWTLVGSLTGYLGLLDFGVRQAVTRYVARAFARDDSGEASRVMSSAAAMFAASAVQVWKRLPVGVATLLGPWTVCSFP